MPSFGVSRLTKSLRLLLKHSKSINKDTVKLIGQDHLGNKYFEAYKPNHIRPRQRYFEKSTIKSFEDIVEATHVPPSWDAWLRFRREEPPTEEEIKDSEEYYRIQQERAAQKKNEEQQSSQTDELKSDDSKGSEKRANRKVPANNRYKPQAVH